MTIYIVILEDHHADVEVEAFRTKKDAIERAEEIVKEYNYLDDDPIECPEGWEFTANLSSAGDCVCVKSCQVIC